MLVDFLVPALKKTSLSVLVEQSQAQLGGIG
jgi:hypothetical protein